MCWGAINGNPHISVRMKMFPEDPNSRNLLNSKERGYFSQRESPALPCVILCCVRACFGILFGRPYVGGFLSYRHHPLIILFMRLSLGD